MKLHTPLGNPDWGGFLLRVPLGAYFMLQGMSKLQDANGFSFVDEVRKINPVIFGVPVLREPLATLYGILLPYSEIVVGVFLIIGMWTTLAAIFSSLMLTSFVLAMGWMVKKEPLMVNKDLVLLGASLSLLYSGAGAWSIDRFRRSAGG